MNRRLDVADVPQRSRWFGPLRGRELVVVNDDAKQLTWAIKKAMWDILDPNRRDMNLANHDFIHGESVMRMVITLPLETEAINEIESDVRDQLDRKTLKSPTPTSPGLSRRPTSRRTPTTAICTSRSSTRCKPKTSTASPTSCTTPTPRRTWPTACIKPASAPATSWAATAAIRKPNTVTSPAALKSGARGGEQERPVVETPGHAVRQRPRERRRRFSALSPVSQTNDVQGRPAGRPCKF